MGLIFVDKPTNQTEGVTTWFCNKLTKFGGLNCCRVWTKLRGFVGRNMECDEEQMRCKGYFKSVRRGRRVLLVGVVCNGIKCARGARFGRLAKMGPKGAGSHANDGRNR